MIHKMLLIHLFAWHYEYFVQIHRILSYVSVVLLSFAGYAKYMHHPENVIFIIHIPEGFDIGKARKYMGFRYIPCCHSSKLRV